ncbi:MAG TPA: NADH:ubiquinone reductase (Na(+)-transporting) subunit B [Cytophagales bacterium]|nr:NADH:ubiquinone reductase (Na(+)-transporting) subunit B [Cytophagales bacterium]HAA17993.1 NADH:ubiquinone reductase (Na(+)-transporting) subunit B [Cytophagales bacterium]
MASQLRQLVDKAKQPFLPGGKLEKLHYVFDGFDTFLFVPNETTKAKGVQIKDAVDLKRMMITVVIAMIPCLLFGIWNVGHQHALATGTEIDLLGKVLIGLKATLPVIIVSYGVGLGIEFLFTTLKKEPINEGFLVTGMLIPLVMPPTIPLWQVALATAFAVIIGKEAFGGTGFNVLNVALTARAFLYFAYPQQISGEVWTYLGDATTVNGYSGATALALAAGTVDSGVQATAAFASSWYTDMFSSMNLFIGTVPGSIGETSTLMALLGAFILVATGVGSWKIIVATFGGAYLTAAALYAAANFESLFGAYPGIAVRVILFILSIALTVGAGFLIKNKELKYAGIGVGVSVILFAALILGQAGNQYMGMPPHYHLIIGGLAFGAVFMATDPVSAAHTEAGKWLYGILIGTITVIIRVFNPAYPEGIMLAVLLMNVIAPLIDFYVISANKKTRLQRVAAV